MREPGFRGTRRARKLRCARCRNVRHAGGNPAPRREGAPTPPSKLRQPDGRIASRGGTAPASRFAKTLDSGGPPAAARAASGARCGRRCRPSPRLREKSGRSSQRGSRSLAPLDRGSSSDRLANRKTIGITRSSGSATQGAARTANGSRCAAAQFASVSVRRAQRRDRGCAASGRVPSTRWWIRCVTPICAGSSSSVGPGSFALAMSAARPLQDLRRGPGERSRAGRTGRGRDE
jgi:hypothetical protein